MIKKLIRQDRDLCRKLELRVGSLEENLQETRNELQEMKPQLTHLIAQVEDLFRIVKSNSSDQNPYKPLKEEVSLRKRNNELEKQSEDLTNQLAEALTDRTNLSEEKRKLECELRYLKESHGHAVDRDKQFQDEMRVKDLITDKDKLLRENKQLQESLDRAKSESCINEIKRELKQCQERNEALEYEIECTNTKDFKSLKKELAVSEQMKSYLELEFETARTQVEDLKHHNELNRQAKSELENTLERTNYQNDVLKAHVSQLSEKTEKQQRQIDSLLEKRDLLSTQLKQSNQNNEEKVSICILFDGGI